MVSCIGISGNSRTIERNLAVRVSRWKLKRGDVNFGAQTQNRACTESACNEPYGRVLGRRG